SNTILLWVTPVVLVLLGGGLLGNAMRKRPTKP
ncbi:MAG TPA: cytochrome c-type biogenesis protein CcmH, partial [Oceanicaulis sp.]|nr:cytochrome c-type biogenesis protein CcmH [Oceanicaulis sp.]